MAVELIRLKIFRPNAAPLHLLGSVIVRSDGVADYFADAADHAETVAGVLGAIQATAPFRRPQVADLDPADGPALLADALRIGETRFIGPLLLSARRPVALGGNIDPGAAAVIHRVLNGFAAAAAARQIRQAA